TLMRAWLESHVQRGPAGLFTGLTQSDRFRVLSTCLFVSAPPRDLAVAVDNESAHHRIRTCLTSTCLRKLERQLHILFVVHRCRILTVCSRSPLQLDSASAGREGACVLAVAVDYCQSVFDIIVPVRCALC